jgi:iron(III) transport system ATP-binding protein
MIDLKKVCFFYSDYFYLSDINLSVKSGNILGLIGQSGSGKSTILKIMAGLLDPANGQVLFNNQKLIPPSQKLIAGNEKIKMVTQSNSLFPNITIKENIIYELRYFKKEYQEKRLKSLSNKFNISHLLNKKPGSLSGGEIQRVMIAKALADEPLLLLLDEPFANLDSLNKKTIINQLSKILQKENIACVFVTHEIHDVLGWADEISILKNGRIVQTSTSEEIYYKPKNQYVAALTGEVFITNKVKSYFRPENIDINKNGKYNSVVENCIFKGNHYEVYFYFEDKLIYSFSKDRIEHLENIVFNITQFNF